MTALVWRNYVCFNEFGDGQGIALALQIANQKILCEVVGTQPMGVVLIVEDHADLRRTLAEILRSYGYKTVEAATGAEAIEKATVANPNLVLMDFSLPDMTGAEVAHALRNNPATGTIPVIGCSAYFGSQYRDAALSSGMVDYLVKPVSINLIKAKIAEFLYVER